MKVIMEIKPLNNKILLVEAEEVKTTESGIIIEGTKGNGDTRRAKVIAIGPKVEFVQVGDEVFVEWNKAKPTKIDGQLAAIVEEDHISAVVEH